MIGNSWARPDEHGGHDEQLAKLGLKYEYFEQLIREGEEARAAATKDDANNAAGTFDYFARVRTLRNLLRTEEQWHRYDPKQSPLTVNPDKTMGIGVLLGDARTGLPGNPQPRSHRPAGVAKESLIARNQDIDPGLFPMPLAEEELAAQRNEDEYANMTTWYLLTFRYSARKQGFIEVRSELSLPSRVGPRGKIDSWDRRILLPAIRFKKTFDYPDGDTGFDVAVEEW
ncbi:hypothetical protein EF903_13200 [Streptomyces sp. WAC05292]|uniref:hypothetical protein n=1 Tax=Streptomyces sp. WAC05292 TaxID=2487418 RepID=UPI000F738AD4|nr:hypothetical protein [Streptomyces sp. WAC05292]RSS89974.1 hypothetical protein EF903_13200 [Streptomyces sp. WAC05292]